MLNRKRTFQDITYQNNNIAPAQSDLVFTPAQICNVLNKKDGVCPTAHPLHALLQQNIGTFRKFIANGFELSRVMNILYGAGLTYVQAVNALVDSADEMIRLKNEGMGTCTICSALKNANRDIPTVLVQLEKNKGTLIALSALGYEDEQISSLLSGVNTATGEILTCIQTNLQVFQDLKDKGFLPPNVSGIFHNVGRRVPECIENLKNNMTVIQRYLDLGFKPKNFSSMLYSKGGHLAEIFKTLDENYIIFQNEISNNPNVGQLTYSLKKINPRTFTENIENLGLNQAADILRSLGNPSIRI